MKRKSLFTILWITFFVGTFTFVFFTKEKSPLTLFLNLGVAALYCFTISLGNTWINKILSERFSWVEETRTRTILGILATVSVNTVLVLLCNYVNLVIVQKQNFSGFFSGNMGLINWFGINMALLISLFLHAKNFMEEWKKSTRKEVVEQKLIARSANAQFESLKNQLDPHFLFNSLNVLSALIDENPDQAQHFTASMSKIYRYILEQKDKELVSVEEELDFAKTYSDLLKTRFEDSVTFNFNVPANERSYYVVPLSLQLLIENCIKHNYATSRKPLEIRIYSDNGYLFVENNLQAREQVKESAGIGLSNIVQRYALLTKQNVFIEKSEDFFRVKIPILIEKITAMITKPTSESIAYENATKRVKELKSFYGNLASYCLVIPFLIFVNMYTSPQHQWFWWPMLGWGIGIASHGLQVFGIGRNWEEKQIRKILEKENKN